MSTKYCITKFEEKKPPHFFKLCPRDFSFNTIHLYKKKYTWSINSETNH